MSKMKWKDVTNTFDEESRHYQKIWYMEKCEIYGEDDKLMECNLSISTEGEGRIYIRFGIMYGDIYVDPPKNDIYKKYEEVKSELQSYYDSHEEKEPDDDFINEFCDKYGVTINNVFGEGDMFEAWINMLSNW